MLKEDLNIHIYNICWSMMDDEDYGLPTKMDLEESVDSDYDMDEVLENIADFLSERYERRVRGFSADVLTKDGTVYTRTDIRR